jgi:hypothetical protein
MSPIHIDDFSLKPIYLETYLKSVKIGVATGFAIKDNNSYFLCTNWHVVTCRHPDNNQPIFTNGIADPDTIRAWFHTQPLGTWKAKDLRLLDEHGQKLWKEHNLGRQIDVVAIPFQISSDITVYDIDLALADFDLMLYPSEPVSIIGFPEGLTSGGYLPIWKTGHIASDIEIDWNGKPLFLIDATTKSGMSGSPVIAKRVSIYQTSKTNQIGNAVKFLGVYSGREIGTAGVEVGFVWKPRVISEIVR